MNELGTSGRPGDLRHGVEGWRGERWRSVGVEEWRSGGGEEGRRGGEEEWRRHGSSIAWLSLTPQLSINTAPNQVFWNVECGAQAAP